MRLRNQNIVLSLALTCLGLDTSTYLVQGSNNFTIDPIEGYEFGVSPNIPPLQSEDLNQGLQEKRQLTYADTTLPWNFLLGITDCPADIVMTGFGLRDASNFVVSGYIDTTSNTCAKLKGSSQTDAAIVSFVSSQTTSGLVTWYKSFKAATSVFQSLIISSNNVLVVYYNPADIATSPVQALKVAKLSISTGAFVSEINIEPVAAYLTNGVASFTGFGLFRSQLTTNRNYFTFVSVSSTPTYSTGLFRFDDDFALTYTRTISKQTASNKVHIVDMDFNTDYSLAVNYNDLSTAAWNLMVVNETTGETIAEMDWAQTVKATNKNAIVRLDTTAATAAAPPYYLCYFDKAVALNYDTIHLVAGVLTVQAATPTVAINAPTTLKKIDKALISPQLEITSSSKLVFTAIEVVASSQLQNTLDSEILHVYYLTNTLTIIKHFMLQRGAQGIASATTKQAAMFMRYYTAATKQSALYLAYNIPEYLQYGYPNRVVYFKFNPSTNEPYGFDCEASPTAFLTSTITYTATTTSTDFYASENNTATATQAFASTVKTLSSANPRLYVYDSTSSLATLTFVDDFSFSSRSLMSTVTASGASLTVGYSLGSGTSIPILLKSTATTNTDDKFTIAVIECGATTSSIDCKNLRYPNDTAVNTQVANKLVIASSGDIAGQTSIQVSMKTLDYSLASQYVGSSTFELVCQLGSSTTDTIQPHVRYNIYPEASKILSHPASPFSAAATCKTPIYPFFFGSDYQVTINYLGTGTGSSLGRDLLIAGQGKGKPFAPSGTTVAKGFIALLDSFGQPYWIYTVDADSQSADATTNYESNCFHASRSLTNNLAGVSDGYSIFAVCRAYNMEAKDHTGVIVSISETTGIVRYVKFLPRDYVTTGTAVTPFFVHETSDGNLVVGMKYQYTGAMNTFAVLKVGLDTTKKFYTRVLSCANTQDAYGYYMLTDPTGAKLYALWNGLDAAYVYLFDLTSANANGEITAQHKFTAAAKSGRSIPELDSNGLAVPYVSLLGTDVQINLHASADLTLSTKVKFTLSGNTQTTGQKIKVTSASITNLKATDNTALYHLVLSGDVFIYMSIKADLSTIVSQKIWQYNSALLSGSYEMSGAFVLQSTSFVFAAHGKWSSTSTYESSVIYRINALASLTDTTTANDFSCVAFRDVWKNEQSSAFSYVAIAANSGATGDLKANAAITKAGYYDHAIYRQTEFMVEGDGISLKTTSFSEMYEWGFDLIPNHYDFRVPQMRQQCGAYARQKDRTASLFYQLVDANGLKTYGDFALGSTYTQSMTLTEGKEFENYYLELELGQLAYVDIGNPAINCQQRPMKVVVFTSGNADLKIEPTWIVYDSATRVLSINAGTAALKTANPYTVPTRLLMQDDFTKPEPGTYAIVIRYQDANDANTYYDHPLIVRVKPNTAAQHSKYVLMDSYECYQNPYPTSFGGCPSSTSASGCKTYVEAFFYDVETQVVTTPTPISTDRTQIYIAGNLGQDVSFMGHPTETTNDAFIMKINDMGIPVWFTSFDLSRQTGDSITALTKVGDYIYAFLITADQSQSAFLKVGYLDGMLLEQKSLNFYNLLSGAFYFDSLRNMQPVLATGFLAAQHTFAATFTYKSSKTNSKKVGSIRVKDANLDTTSEQWSLTEFVSMYERDNYDYVAGTQLYKSDSANYYEAHLAKTSAGQNLLYYLEFSLNANGQSDFADEDGYEIKITGDIVNEGVQPVIQFDKNYNVFTNFYTSSNGYILKHNVTSATKSLTLYTFTTVVTGELLASKLDNFDLLYLPKQEQFMVVLTQQIQNNAGIDNKGMFFFTIDAYSMAVQSKIRYDSIGSSTNKGRIAFYDPILPTTSTYRDYFTYVRNVPKFSSAGTNEILVNRKAIMYSDDNKFDCRPSDVYPKDAGGLYNNFDITGTEKSFADVATDSALPTPTTFSIITLAQKKILFYSKITTEPKWVEPVTILNNPYVQSIYMQNAEMKKTFPQQYVQDTAYYAGAQSSKCSDGTGVQPPNTIDLAPISVNLNTAASSKTIYGNTFQQCQNLGVQSTFLYEDGTNVQTADNVFVKFTNGAIAYDLQNYQPAPGTRLLQFKANTVSDAREVFIAQPFQILPKGYNPLVNDAPTDPKTYTCTSANDFPKIIGDTQNDFTQNGADVDQKNGNTIICGSTKANAYPNSFFSSTKDSAMNLLTNLEGTIYWSYTASYIKSSGNVYSDLAYSQCSFDGQTSVYSLLQVKDTTLQDLVIVKQEYKYGKYVYSKRVPGNFENSFAGFVLIKLDDDNNGTPETLYSYVFGTRSGEALVGGLTTQNHFSKLNLQGSYPYQVWNAYSTIANLQTASTLVGIQRMGASSSAVFALSHFVSDKETSGTFKKYANLAKYNAVSGEMMKQVNYAAELDSPSLSFAIDSAKRLIYLSSATQTNLTPLKFKRYIRRFDLDLVPDGSIKFEVALDSSTISANVHFVSDLYYTDDHLLEVFSFEANKYFFVAYSRQTLNIKAYKQFTQTDLKVSNLFIRSFINNNAIWLLSFSTNKGFLSKTYTSSVFKKLTFDTTTNIINDENTCLSNYYTDVFSTLVAGTDNIPDPSSVANDAIVAIEAAFSFYYTPSYYNLQPALNLYWEQKLYPEQISFKPAMNLECSSSGLLFPEDLKHQVVRLPMNKGQDKVYSFPLPAVCDLTQLVVTLQVDKYATVPSFISGKKIQTWEGNFYRIVFSNSITAANAGTYNVRISMTLGAATVSDSFILHIYPETAYGSSVESFECDNKYNFMSFGGQVGNIYNHVDLDLTSGDYIMCGANKLKNTQNTNYYQSFVQSITQGHAVAWHLTLEAGEYDNIAQYCGLTDEQTDFNGEKLIVTVVNSENFKQGSNQQFNSSIYIFQHQRDAQFVNAKQIYNIDAAGVESTMQAEGFYLNKKTAELYINGIVDGFAISHNSLGFFILKLSKYLTMTWYSVFDFGQSPAGGNMIVDIDNLGASTNMYSVFGYQSDTEAAYRWGLIKMKSADGTVYVDGQTPAKPYVRALINGVQLTRNNTRNFYQQGLLLNNNAAGNRYIYSCLLYKAGQTHDEVAITEQDTADLSSKRNLEMSRGYVPLESCSLAVQSTTGLLVMALGTFEYTHIFAFDLTKANIQNVSSYGLVYYHQRYIPFKIQMFERTYPTTPVTKKFSLFIRTNGFDLNEDQLFITKFSNISGQPTWDNPCTKSEIQFDTTSTFYLSMNAPNGVKTNEMQYWAAVDYAYKQVQTTTFEQYYLNNPQKFQERVIQGENAVYRASFLNCSRYSFPTEPYSPLKDASPVEDLDTLLTVRAAPYNFMFEAFQSCSYDTITHRVVYQDGTPLPAFMTFNVNTLTLTINANVNEYSGLYLMKYEAYVNGDMTYATSINFQVYIDKNLAPYPVLNGFNEDSILYQSHTLRWTVNLDFDTEGDTAIFDAYVLDTNGVKVTNPTWFKTVSKSGTALVIEASNAPVLNRVTGDQYYINITVGDAFNVDTPNVYQINLSVVTDSAPTLVSTKNLNLGTISVNVNFNFKLLASDFIDKEGDTPTFSCNILSTTLSNSWITETADKVLNTLTYSGKAPTNDYIGDYIFVCAVTDVYLPGINFYQFRLKVAQNLQILSQAVADVSVIRSNIYIYPNLVSACVDPEAQTITRTLSATFNGVAVANLATAGFTWDPVTAYLSFDYSLSAQVGTYLLSMTCNDGFYSDNVVIPFKLTAVDNQAPIMGSAAPAVGVNLLPTNNDKKDWFFKVAVATPVNTVQLIYDLTNLFTDPENDDLFIDVIKQDGTALSPSSIMQSVQNNQLTLTFINPTTAPVINTLRLRATDPELQVATIDFTVKVKQCDVSCKTCDDETATSCLSCDYNNPLYKFYNEDRKSCSNDCQTNQWKEEVVGTNTYICHDCPRGCDVCTGDDSTTQCTTCSANYFKQTNVVVAPAPQTYGCYYVCPDGFKPNSATNPPSCVAANSAKYLKCISFIDNFKATHPFIESSWSLMASTTHTCTDLTLTTCPKNANGVCSWNRKLALQCRETIPVAPATTTKTYIRVATNSMPNHCIQPKSVFPTENLLDFEVEFSQDTTAASIVKVDLTSQTKVNNVQCPAATAWGTAWTELTDDVVTGTAPNQVTTIGTKTKYGFSYQSGTTKQQLQGIVGIAINGVPIHAGTSELGFDFFAPKGTNARRIEVDTCLGANEYVTATAPTVYLPSTNQFYKYYSFSPCLFTNTISTTTFAADCSTNVQCQQDYLKYAVNNIPSSQKDFAYTGIAKDGHMIVGPYKATGKLWQPCDVDACNGVIMNGEYVYASTLFYPYTVACWGPASKQSQYPAGCSSNTNTCYSADSNAIFMQLSAMLMMIVLALYMF